MVKCSFFSTESVLRVRNQGQQGPSEASFHLQERPKSLTSILSFSLRKRSPPYKFSAIHPCSNMATARVFKTYTDHVLIHRGLQSLGYTELLKVMVSFARYSQTSIFYSPQHPNYWNVVKVYYIFACQLICKYHTYLLTHSEKHTRQSSSAKGSFQLTGEDYMPNLKPSSMLKPQAVQWF